VLRQALYVVAIGLVIGVAGALAVARLLASWLYGVGEHDPLTFTLVPLALGAIALLASYIPARCATRVDPALALRCE
jgi:ABC-type antimicrobial peptide transport system permease subunit